MGKIMVRIEMDEHSHMDCNGFSFIILFVIASFFSYKMVNFTGFHFDFEWLVKFLCVGFL